MSPEEEKSIREHLQQVASILYQNTPMEELKNFETIELTVRKQMIDHVAPTIANFFLTEVVDVEEEKKELLKVV